MRLSARSSPRPTPHLARFSTELDGLAEPDRELYRTVFHASPVADARRRMRAGARIGRSTAPANSLVEYTSGTLDRVARQVAPQRRSHAELRTAAGRRDAALASSPPSCPSATPA